MPSSGEFRRIASADVPAIWPEISTGVKSALAYDPLHRRTSADIYDELVGEHMQLWAKGGSAAVTQMIQYPQIKVCEVVLAFGEMDEILDDVVQIEMWAKDQGCAAVECMGRDGWVRVMMEQGWRKHFAVVGKEI